MKLPPLHEPNRYVGLYVYDFGDHASVGYTAEEIEILLTSDAHRGGKAYRIYRIDDRGQVELQGVSAGQLCGEDILVFACRDKNRAADEFSALSKLAGRQPPPCSARLELVDLPDLDPPHAVCLRFPRYAAEQISRWLTNAKFGGGDVVLGGQETLTAYREAGPAPIAAYVVQGDKSHQPRTRDEVFAAIHETLQR
jgi:hypothetical protein